MTCVEGTTMAHRLHDEAYAEFVGKLHDELRRLDATEVSELWGEVGAKAEEGFMKRCSNDHLADREHDFPAIFASAVQAAIVDRSQRLARQEVMRRQKLGEEISMGMNFVAIMDARA